MAVFAKDGIEARNILRDKPELVNPPEPIIEVEITGETDAQRKKREKRNQEKRVGWENRCQKAREKGVFCSSVAWDAADAEVRSFFLSLSRHRRSTASTAKTARVDIQLIRPKISCVPRKIIPPQKELLHSNDTTLFVVSKKNQSREQFYADLGELASRAGCHDREKNESGTCSSRVCITIR